MTDNRRLVVWLNDDNWEGSVDAAAALVGASPGVLVEMLYVIDPRVGEASHGAFVGLLGRGSRRHDPGTTVDAVAVSAARGLVADAIHRLGGAAVSTIRTGVLEREVVAACEQADLLICARDGDQRRLGPRSLGRATRFVVDHAPCAVLLIWPGSAPALGSIPPPPDHSPPDQAQP